MSLVVISPHLDDAVLSCGQLLAAYPGSTVVSVFAGIPTTPDLLTPFDRSLGFDSSAQAMSARREEDRRACAVLDAVPVWLDLLDSQYVEEADRTSRGREREVITALAEVALDLDDTMPIFTPWGIQHPDHELVRWCAETVFGNWDFHLYEDLPGRVLWPQADNIRKRSEQVAGPLHLKQAAIACYRSQHVLPELAPPWHSCLVPERYWEGT